MSSELLKRPILSRFDGSDDPKKFIRMEKLMLWSQRMKGARQMLVYLHLHGCLNLAKGVSKKDGGEVYAKALYDWLMEDYRHIEEFLSDEPRYYINHKRDEKGKLISCEITTNRALRGNKTKTND